MTVYDRPFSLNHGKCAVTDRAYSGSNQKTFACFPQSGTRKVFDGCHTLLGRRFFFVMVVLDVIVHAGFNAVLFTNF